MLISDVVAVVSPDTFRRPTYAGNALETVQSGDAKKVVTVRASAFPASPVEGVKRVTATLAETSLSRVVSEEAQGSFPAAGPSAQKRSSTNF
jgi:electron transfer flavoprotein alpha subunit